MDKFVDFLKREADIIGADTAEEYLMKVHRNWGNNPDWHGKELEEAREMRIASAEEDVAKRGYDCVPSSTTVTGRLAVWFGRKPKDEGDHT